ncbi:MAG: Cna B-type domain-containing protein, partial [Lachnospiraceae bacterium]|nr:Cna B-type domain-containing protein [Lachnospiraceae bacterium]
EGNWRASVELPRYSNGQEITYTVSEVQVEGYETEIAYSGGGRVVTITNTHEPTPDPATFTLTATKSLTGRALNAGEFSFILADADGHQLTAVNDASGVITFPEMTFAAAGTYEYTMYEVPGTLGGVTYDTHNSQETGYAVTVEVTNVDGKLSATLASDPVTFTNTYAAAPVDAQITARKVLTGRDLQADEFSFQLLDANGNVLQTVKNAANGAISFEAITYSAAGVYNYTIVETAGNAEGITYDSHRFGVTVTVTDNGQGALTAEVSYTDGQPVFSNIYVPPATPAVPTGDSTNAIAYVAIALAAAAVCLGSLIARKRAR